MNQSTALTAVQAAHTAIWAFFVACIFGAPVAAWFGNFALAAVFVGFVALEALALLVNKWYCPLTKVAARYTEQREENFDIYLPLWLAKYNKSIFTPLYLLGAAYSAYLWWHQG